MGKNARLPGPSTAIFSVFASIVVAAIYASVGDAALALGRPRAQAAVEAGGPYAKTARRLLSAEERIIARMLAGRVVFVCLGTAIATSVFLQSGAMWATYIATGIVAFIYSAVVEVAATLARKHANVIALPLLRWARPLEFLVIPIAAPVSWLGRAAGRLFRARREDNAERVVTLQVEQAIEEAEEIGSISEEVGDLVRGALEFKDIEAKEIMVPRTSVVAIAHDTSLEDALEIVKENGHSRYPVYRETLDHVVGILYAKDLFTAFGSTERSRASFPPREPTRLSQLVRDNIFFIAESQKIGSVLREMRARRLHLAVVVDEFGGTSGVLTLEDILEEIVGDIQDEHDTDELPVREIAPGRFLADGRVSLNDLEEILGVEIPETDGQYDSVAGMLMERAGKVLEAGQTMVFGPLEITVRESDQRRIRQVEIVRMPVA